MILIYKHTNMNNGKQYVGQTIRTMEERWDQHCEPDDSNNHFHNAIVKYGPDCWTHEIIAEYDDEIGNEAEVYWISYLDTFRNGYNSTTGGDSEFIRSEETKKKIRESNLGKKRTEETKKRISESHSGERNPFFEKVHTEETKKKMSEWQKGVPKSLEVRLKISKAKCTKIYIITDKYGNEFEISNLRAWCRENNMNQGNMAILLTGRRKSCKGYTIRYKEH